MSENLIQLGEDDTHTLNVRTGNLLARKCPFRSHQQSSLVVESHSRQNDLLSSKFQFLVILMALNGKPQKSNTGCNTLENKSIAEALLNGDS